MRIHLYAPFVILCYVPNVLMGMEAPTLNTMPEDVIKTITDKCGPLERAALRRTCARFRDLLAETRQQDSQIARTVNLTDLVRTTADFNMYKDRTTNIASFLMLAQIFLSVVGVHENLAHVCTYLLHKDPGSWPLIICQLLIAFNFLYNTLVFKYQHHNAKIDPNLTAKFRRQWPQHTNDLRVDADFRREYDRLNLSEFNELRRRLSCPTSQAMAIVQATVCLPNAMLTALMARIFLGIKDK